MSFQNQITTLLSLNYKKPFNFSHTLSFLKTRAIKGVEVITDQSYSRTFRSEYAEGFSWATINSEANEGKRLFCPPEYKAVSQNDYLYIFNRYIDENKSWIADETSIQPIIIKSLIAAFPCNG